VTHIYLSSIQGSQETYGNEDALLQVAKTLDHEFHYRYCLVPPVESYFWLVVIDLSRILKFYCQVRNEEHYFST
jgi:hypothetical protein